VFIIIIGCGLLVKYGVQISCTYLGGVVQIAESGSEFKLTFVDQLPVIDVRYVSFAGYGGRHTKVKFDCVDVATTDSDYITDEKIGSETTAPPLTNSDDAINEIL